MEKKNLDVNSDLYHCNSILTFLTLTALFICVASLEIIQKINILLQSITSIYPLVLFV